MIQIEVYWDDLTEAKQNEIREALKMEPDDKDNWDIFPIATLDFEEEGEELEEEGEETW